LRIPHQKSEVPGGIVTISVGVAVAVPTPQGAAADLVLGADRSMYAAKDAGRGQVKALQM
jgi:PleD family two-component response regulator